MQRCVVFPRLYAHRPRPALSLLHMRATVVYAVVVTIVAEQARSAHQSFRAVHDDLPSTTSCSDCGAAHSHDGRGLCGHTDNTGRVGFVCLLSGNVPVACCCGAGVTRRASSRPEHESVVAACSQSNCCAGYSAEAAGPYSLARPRPSAKRARKVVRAVLCRDIGA
jgi:hypothetical protein